MVMLNFPDTEEKLKDSISQHETEFKKEKDEHGAVRDGDDKRYLLFSYHFLLGDFDKTRDYISWYETEFPDDMGEPVQKLCWALSLYRMQKLEEARVKLAELMISNVYFIPFLLKQSVEELDMLHNSNFESIDHIKNIPEAVKTNITEPELDWLMELYRSFEFRLIKQRHVEICEGLKYSKEESQRERLVEEAETLLEILDEDY